MSGVPRNRMSAGEFMAWAMTLAEPGRYELVEGEVVAMGPGRSGHALIKARIWSRLASGARSMTLSEELVLPA